MYGLIGLKSQGQGEFVIRGQKHQRGLKLRPSVNEAEDGHGRQTGFDQRGKPVKYWRREKDVYIFEDPVLKSEEEKDYLIRISKNRRSKREYDENQINFGKLYLLSDLREEPERIYRLYKQREYVEYAFNVYKNDLEADRSYLRDDHMLFTYMFLNLLSLYLHFQILNMIDGRYSMRDVLLILSRIKIYRMESADIMSEIPKKAKELVSDLNIDLDILHKKGMS